VNVEGKCALISPGLVSKSVLWLRTSLYENLFDDPEYDGQFLRTVGYAQSGAQLGEAWAVAAQIKGGDAESWYNAWSS